MARNRPVTIALALLAMALNSMLSVTAAWCWCAGMDQQPGACCKSIGTNAGLESPAHKENRAGSASCCSKGLSSARFSVGHPASAGSYSLDAAGLEPSRFGCCCALPAEPIHLTPSFVAAFDLDLAGLAFYATVPSPRVDLARLDSSLISSSLHGPSLLAAYCVWLK